MISSFFSKNEKQYLEDLKLLLQKLQDHKLKAELAKYSFGVDTVEYLECLVEYLGHKIKNSTIISDPEKVFTVKNWP